MMHERDYPRDQAKRLKNPSATLSLQAALAAPKYLREMRVRARHPLDCGPFIATILDTHPRTLQPREC